MNLTSHSWESAQLLL
uniref:Uncharacterized protein n=1 Tax=Rhizophora mucronata TaxID=61149 RepID=A0A2P2R425_RHIMU